MSWDFASRSQVLAKTSHAHLFSLSSPRFALRRHSLASMRQSLLSDIAASCFQKLTYSFRGCLCSVAIELTPRARFTELNDLKAKVCRTGTQNFAAGLPHCSELHGTNFYFYPRDRALNLQDYRRARSTISSRRGAFNPETRRPWNKQDADGQARVQKTRDHQSGANCAAVASLPSLRQKLKESAMTERRFPPESRARPKRIGDLTL
jgi:hypothetical protein